MSVADVLFEIDPPDDSGAETADRYDWQAAAAAADGMLAYMEACDAGSPAGAELRIICEYHEDWVVCIGSEFELVSAKHREPATGPWSSITILVSAGGIGHLFVRWLELNKSGTARLVTSAALGTGEATGFRDWTRSLRAGDATDSRQIRGGMTVKQCLNKFCRALMMYRKGVPKEWHAPEGARASALRIPRDLLDTAREFLTVLTIDEPRPGRELIDHAAPSLYVAPLMEHMGHPPASAESVWQAVRELFRARMRSNVLSKGVGGGLAGHVKRCRFGMDSHETIEIRTVTLSDIKLAILMALQNPQAYSLLTPPPFVTKLSVKMAHGGCSDNSIYRAERLRIDYNNYRRDRREMVPGSSIEDREIERYLSRVADEETSTSATPSGMWGDKLWRGLSNRLDSSRNGEFEGLDGDLALGGICELSARCEVWFSPRFDVDQAIASALEISEKS